MSLDAHDDLLVQEGAEDLPALSHEYAGTKRPKRFLPFSSGSRDCVGQTLAKLNLTTTLAQLYGNFSFALADEVLPTDNMRYYLRV